MNEQNWQLAAGQDDSYRPNRLPFFQPASETAAPKAAVATEEAEGLIKLKRVKSHAS